MTISRAFSGPWLMMGDFNSILSQAEKIGGNQFASSSTYTLLDDLNKLALIDLGYHGYPYTWNNKRSGKANIQERLDRGVANDLWCTSFPHASILHLPALSSDHNPILLNTNIQGSNVHRPFRFEPMWIEDPTCSDIISKAWRISLPITL